MTNAELIKALRYCISDEYVEKGCLICPICAPRQGEMKCNSQDDAIKYAAAALEEAEKRIARLEEDLKTREAEREIMKDTIKICEEAADRYKAQLPKEGEWIDENRRTRSSKFVCSTCKRTCYDIQPTRDKAWTKRCRYNYCPSCGAKMKTVTDCHTLEEGER